MADDQQDSSWTDRLARLFTQSGIFSLTLLGRAIENLGVATVIAFLAGAGSVYGYALFKPLPGAVGAQQQPPTKAERVTLMGEVTTMDGEELDQFMVALRSNEEGPFRGGKFELPNVPLADHYSLIIWQGEAYSPLAMTQPLRAVPENRAKKLYKLLKPIGGFPSRLARISGKITDQDGRAVVGRVEIAGSAATIASDGSFEITNIPVGNFSIVVKDARGNQLRQEHIKVEQNDPTLFERQIPVPQR